jgi:hypothetical protein
MTEDTTFEKALFKFRYKGVVVCFPLTDNVYFAIREESLLKGLLNDFADSFENDYNCKIIEWGNNLKIPCMEWELMFSLSDERDLEERKSVLSDLMNGSFKLIERLWKLKAIM